MVAGNSDKLRSHAPCEAQYYIRANMHVFVPRYFILLR